MPRGMPEIIAQIYSRSDHALIVSVEEDQMANFQKSQKKNKSSECFCALCSTPRKLKYSRNLSKINYIQIIMLTGLITYGTYSWFGLKGATTLPVVWIIFETIHKSLYRKELTCPYCGFDPTWYKKDIKFARKKVEEFLKQNPDSPILLRAKKLQEISENHLN